MTLVRSSVLRRCDALIRYTRRAGLRCLKRGTFIVTLPHGDIRYACREHRRRMQEDGR